MECALPCHLVFIDFDDYQYDYGRSNSCSYQSVAAPLCTLHELCEVVVGVCDSRLQHGAGLSSHSGLLHGHAHAAQSLHDARLEGGAH